MIQRPEIVRLLRSLRDHVPSGRAPALRAPERLIDRASLGDYSQAPGIPAGQFEDRRYPLREGALHEHRHRDGTSLFHLDRVHTGESIAKHYLYDTRGPEAAATGLIVGLVCRHPLLGLGTGALVGAFIPRGQLIVFELERARKLALQETT